MLRSFVSAQNALHSFLARPLRSDRGVTAVEYALLLALIAGVIITIVFTLGQHVKDTFSTVNNGFNQV